MIRIRCLDDSCLCVKYVCLVGAVMAACAGEETPDPIGPTTVAAVSVTPERDTLVALGATRQFTASATDGSGNAVSGVTFVWSSTDTTIATVSSAGLVTAWANGATSIRATTADIQGEATAVVQQVVTNVAVTGGADTLTALGDTTRFVAEPRDARSNPVVGRTVAWRSSDSTVLAVTDGLVTARGVGNAVVFAEVDGQEGSRPVEVHQMIGAVTLVPDTTRFNAIGATQALVASAVDPQGNAVPTAAFTWTSTDTTVVTVDDQGVATAQGNGRAQVVATATGTTTGDAAEVEVAQETRSFAVSPPDTTDALGDTLAFQATPLDSLGHAVAGAVVTWQSRSPQIGIVVSLAADTAHVVSLANGTAWLVANSGPWTDSTVLVVSQLGANLAVATAPAGARAGTAFTTQPSVHVVDRLGTDVATDSVTVITAVIDSGGGTLAGTATATAVAGVATFSNLSVRGLVGDRTLRFDAAGLASARSGPFAVVAGDPATLNLESGDNQTGLADTPLAAPFVVSVADSFTNLVAGASVAWNVVSGGSLTDTTTSDSTGMTSNTYRLGRFAEVDTVDAVLAGSPGATVRFHATANPNATIDGTITLAGGFLAPPLSTTVAVAALEPRPDQRLVVPTRTGTKPAALPVGVPSQTGSPVTMQSPSPTFVPDELIVTFRSATLSLPAGAATGPDAHAYGAAFSAAVTNALTPADGDSVLTVAGVSPLVGSARLKVSDAASLDSVRLALSRRTDVAAVERNPIVQVTSRTAPMAARAVPGDPYYPLQAWHYAMIDGPEAWDMTTGNASVLVAVVDDGIRYDHDGIASSLTSDGYDFVHNQIYSVCSGGLLSGTGDGDGPDSDPTQPDAWTYSQTFGCVTSRRSEGNHGLHVAGTIGSAGSDGKWGSGVNWNVSIRPVRVLDIAGFGTFYDIAQGILYAAGLPADNGSGGVVFALGGAADIINLSLGGSTSTTILADAVRKADSVGSLIVASAGNSSSSAPSYPAAYPEVVSVSAVSPLGTIASYSNFGSTVDIAAPGGETQPGTSWGVWSTVWNYVTGSPAIAGWQGTSMAAPHVSGVAALLLADDPSLTSAQLKNRLYNYAIDRGAAGRDNLYGHGIVNARNSLTQSFGPVRSTHAVLIDQTSGGIVQTAPASTGGHFSFNQLPDGEYWVFGGEDADGDGILATPFRRWGALGGTATPGAITVNGAASHGASFSIALPIEDEPNNTFGGDNALPAGGYVGGVIANTSDVDVYSVIIPAAGTYTFETLADGACGLAGWEDTILQLYDATFQLLVEHDDIDSNGLNFCSRIVQTLQPGQYYLAVWGWLGAAGYYLESR